MGEKSSVYIGTLKDKIQEKRGEITKELRQKEILDQSIKDLKSSSDEHNADLRGKEQQLHHEGQMLQRIEGQVKESAMQEAKLENEFKRLNEEKRVSENKLDEEMGKNMKLIK